MSLRAHWDRLRDLLPSSAARDGGRGPLAERYVAMVHRFEARNLRERALIVLCIVGGLVLLWDVLWMQPLYARERKARTVLDQVAPKGDGAALTDLAQLVDSEKELSAQVAVHRQELERGAASLIDAARMPDVLASVIASTRGLRMLRIASLPVEELRVADGAQAEAQSTVIDSNAANLGAQQANAIPAVAYLHGMEIVVEGDYGAIHSYVRALERQPWRFIWRKVELDAVNYPRVHARLVVATLGLERHWLAL